MGCVVDPCTGHAAASLRIRRHELGVRLEGWTQGAMMALPSDWQRCTRFTDTVAEKPGRSNLPRRRLPCGCGFYGITSL
ncbi:hypothetical protein R1flu_016886 [Riccia fluitans]|uniref:Uncharacterized protein n=1 Tax=Riccia fluitans TaxID=41844 RepID=A0ABD1YNY2_9MARC